MTSEVPTEHEIRSEDASLCFAIWHFQVLLIYEKKQVTKWLSFLRAFLRAPTSGTLVIAINKNDNFFISF